MVMQLESVAVFPLVFHKIKARLLKFICVLQVFPLNDVNTCEISEGRFRLFAFWSKIQNIIAFLVLLFFFF